MSECRMFDVWDQWLTTIAKLEGREGSNKLVMLASLSSALSWISYCMLDLPGPKSLFRQWVNARQGQMVRFSSSALNDRLRSVGHTDGVQEQSFSLSPLPTHHIALGFPLRRVSPHHTYVSFENRFKMKHEPTKYNQTRLQKTEDAFTSFTQVSLSLCVENPPISLIYVIYLTQQIRHHYAYDARQELQLSEILENEFCILRFNK